MDVFILGPLLVWSAGRPVPVRGTKRRSLFGRLALSANRVVPADALIEDVWGGDSGRRGATLQTSIYQLRCLLGDDGDRLRWEAGGYLLAIAPEELDAGRFEGLLVQVREGRLDLATRANLLSAASGLWRGSVLGELTGATWVHAEAARLDALRAQGDEDWADSQLALGHHAEVVARLTAAVAAEPLRERRAGQLMVALYRSGRQAEALGVYRQLRARLVEDLGIEPTGALARLETAILRQDHDLDAPGPAPGRRCQGRPPAPSTVWPSGRRCRTGP